MKNCFLRAIFVIFCWVIYATWRVTLPHEHQIESLSMSNRVTYVKSETAKIAETLQPDKIDNISIFGPSVGYPFDPDISEGATDMQITVRDPALIQRLLWDLRQSQTPVGAFAVPGCMGDTLRIHFKPDNDHVRPYITRKFYAHDIHYCFSPEFYHDLQILIHENKQRLHAD